MIRSNRQQAKANSKGKILGFALGAMLFMLGYPAYAQKEAKIAKIGEMVSRGQDRPGLGTGRELFRRSLRELGYVEGKNISFETRSAEGKIERFAALAEELVRLKVDVRVTSAPDETLAASNATKSIPIVFVAQSDPVAAGFVDSLARPGGNITGITTFSTELSGKRLELLKEIIPNLSRVAVLWSNRRGSGQSWKESQLVARELGLRLHSMEISSADKLESAFKAAIKAGSAAISVTQNPLMPSIQKQTVELAAKSHLPAIYPRSDYVAYGGLMSYGSDQTEPYQRAAVMIDKILKGAKPADLPVEQPTKFELVINLKTAKQIGLTIPPNVLARADKVIR
jgi:putative tryptophan/tyrosine transport system substrate-binding protein